MAVIEKPLTPSAIPLNSKCNESDHHFDHGSIVPPGSLCDCGRKVRVYETCPTCGQMAPSIKDAVKLQEEESYV